MSFDKISDVIREAERESVLAGVPAARAAEILMRAESELVRALVDSNRAERQLLLALREIGATQLASAKGCSRAQVYRLRDRALNKLSKSAVGM